MSYNFDPREALAQVCEAAAETGPFPPRSAGRMVSQAIDVLKARSADPQQIAIAERLSVLLYRLEVSSWAKGPDEARGLRDAIAAQIGGLTALPAYEAVEYAIPEGLEDTKFDAHDAVSYPEKGFDSAMLPRDQIETHGASIGGPDCY